MIEFTKMNGNGNNFLIFENFEADYSDDALKALAIKSCNTKFSIGADGILVVEKSDIADFKMRLFNSNGTEGEMCGNGSRCIAKYAYCNGIAKEKMYFETLAGIIEANILDNEVKVSMGRVDLSDMMLENSIIFEDHIIKYSYLVVGVPHFVTFCDSSNIYTMEDMKRIGRSIDNNREVFPHGANVNFVQIIDGNTIRNITYERGVEDITESCGTGSSASVIVASILYKLNSPVMVKNLGGDNKVWIEFDADKKHCDIQLQGAVSCCAQIKMFDL